MSINEFEKWPTDKRKYDSNYLRIYGRECPLCHGSGVAVGAGFRPCDKCDGLGYIEQERTPDEQQGGTVQ